MQRTFRAMPILPFTDANGKIFDTALPLFAYVEASIFDTFNRYSTWREKWKQHQTRITSVPNQWTANLTFEKNLRVYLLIKSVRTMCFLSPSTNYFIILQLNRLFNTFSFNISNDKLYEATINAKCGESHYKLSYFCTQIS